MPDSPATTRHSIRRLSARAGVSVAGYLRHLMNVNEPTAARILTLHNIAFLVDLVADARTAISGGSFETFRQQINEVWA